MKQTIQKFRVAPSFRNVCIGVGVAMATTPVLADYTEAVSTEIASAKTDATSIGVLIAGALVVLAAAGLVFSLLRKA
ncbi:major capsid protein [Stutzerimonas kirkiae]|uniref:major capsid protein n=1 Tax=Stutzerimonas kirkiae TaxID=2211392 RepID=UPI00103837EB|nr:major capsid protein [Stutzerimonas kirkiae]TBV13210.1 capsid protein [Stutzerimonas kirkiae]